MHQFLKYVLLPFLLFAGCAGMQGSYEGGVYTAPTGSFSFSVPDPQMTWKFEESPPGSPVEWVEVTMWGDWRAPGGLFVVEWIPADKIFGPGGSFNKTDAQGYLEFNLEKNNVASTFETVKTGSLNVKGRQAEQLAGRTLFENTQALWVTTLINFGDMTAAVTSVRDANSVRSGAGVFELFIESHDRRNLNLKAH